MKLKPTLQEKIADVRRYSRLMVADHPKYAIVPTMTDEEIAAIVGDPNFSLSNAVSAARKFLTAAYRDGRRGPEGGAAPPPPLSAVASPAHDDDGDDFDERRPPALPTWSVEALVAEIARRGFAVTIAWR